MKPPVRYCAVYTRKSTDERLDMEFNSLDAQRESCLAYIASQKAEGWVPVKKSYDDGGFSGGNMDRPALNQLLEDIKAGLVHIIVVYKIDRLTRSLMDFAKLVQVFDEYGVTFVSITQSFNTTTSMGRLTLNVLLSFAQFEREVAGERIRDKIAASKKKGMWMGGKTPLGYIASGRSLTIHPEEANLVRHIFDRYQALGSVGALTVDLRRNGHVSKLHNFESGVVYGGKPFSRGALYTILSNPVYIGRIRHKDSSYEGQHEAIIPAELWQAVQDRLQTQASCAAGSRKSRDINLLKGLLFDGDGTPYSPTYTTKGKQQYRYYISQNLVQYRNHPKGIMARLPAQGLEHTIEQAVRSQLQNIQELTKLLGDRQNHDALEHITLHQSEISAAALVAAIIKRVTVGEQLLKLELRCRELKNLLNDKLQLSLLDPETESKIIEIPFEPRRGRKGALVIEAQGIKKDMFDLPPEALKKLVQGFIWRDEHFGGMTIQDIAAREGLTAPYLGQHIFRTFEQ